MTKSLTLKLLAITMVLALIHCEETEEETRKKKEDLIRSKWQPDPNIDPSKLPLRLTTEDYDRLVVDPKTNTQHPGKPWLILFYYEDCWQCFEFKKLFEKIANEHPDIANYAMVNAIKEELLKETFGLKAYPNVLFLKNGKIYEYQGSNSVEQVAAFIEKNHQDKEHYSIPARIGPIGLQLVYLQRNQKQYEEKLDEYLFGPVGFKHLKQQEKFYIVGGGAAALLVISLLSICSCCCKKDKKKVENKGSQKPSSRSNREKID